MSLRLALVKRVVAWQLGGWDEGTIADQRAKLDKATSRNPLPAGVEPRAVSAGGVPAAWINPPGAGSGVLLYLHGGVYALGGINSCRALAAALAQAGGVRGLALEYRLAPENPYPAAVADVVAAYRWLLSQGIEARQIVFAGDSAGGGLALAGVLALREAGLPLPAAVVCLSPWADLTLSGETMHSKAAVDPVFESDTLAKYVEFYAVDHDRKLPGISPIFADLAGFPPLLIQVGSDEVLLDDARRLAQRAEAAGVEVALQVWEGLFHVFQTVGPLKEAKQAVADIGRFVAAAVGSG